MAEPGRAKWELLTALGICMCALALLAATGDLFGITYDEPIYQSKSLRALEWLELAARSPSYAASAEAVRKYWDAKDAHPGFIKLLSAVCGVTLGSVTGPASALRTGTNLLVALCLGALYLFVSGIWGRAAGLYAVGALLLMPRVFADAHLAALDAPIMAMTFMTLAAGWWACQCGCPSRTPSAPWEGLPAPTGPAEAPRSRLKAPPADGRVAHARDSGGSDRALWTRAAVVGVLFGLALGTKLNAFFLPFVLLPWAFIFARRAALPLLVSLAVLGPLVFWGSWPWLWHETWPRFLEYFLFHFKHWEITILYFGQIHKVAPWHYPLVMTAITTPPVTLLLALAGLTELRSARRDWASGGAARARVAALVLIAWALVVNFVPSCLPTTPKYNGVRLFLPVFPLLAVLAAVGFRAGLDWIGRRPGGAAQGREDRLKLAAHGLFAALIGPLSATAQTTPYQLSYYNALIGGLPGAERAGMEPTYWGDAYRAAALWLAQKAEPGATVWVEPPGFESSFRLFELAPMRPDLRFSAGPDAIKTANYAVTQNKPTEWTDITRGLIATHKPVYTDGIEGVPLIYVFRLR